jgi:ribosomal protein L37E
MVRHIDHSSIAYKVRSMKNPYAWIDGKPLEFTDFPDHDDFYQSVSDGLFHVGQSYEEGPADTIQCRRCGGKEFNVGQGSYFTAIRCVKCEYELCVHNG